MLSPPDRYNQELLAQVHPSDWVNPTPADTYDLVVIGAGTGGLVVAAGVAGLGLGLKVALIEKHLMGGDCLNVGCVPSKSIIRSGRALADVRDAYDFGVRVPQPIGVDFGAVMERMRKLRSGISHHDGASRFRDLGVDVFLGSGRFLSSSKIDIDGLTLTYKKAVIATGTSPLIPQIEGLQGSDFLTNETVFNLTDCPQRFGIMGAGPIGCELAQTFQRLGSRVVLFHKNQHLLDREDSEASAIIQQKFENDGINLILNCNVVKVESTDTNKIIYYQQNETIQPIEVDHILVATGRVPNIKDLNLEAVGVEYNPQTGVIVNDYLQTTNPRIYACGDIAMNAKFTHAADAAARIVIKNLFFSPFGWGRSRLSDLVIPRVTFTDPEIAQVGKTDSPHFIKIPFTKVDRAILDGETDGFVKIFHEANSDRILGATIVGRHAGEMINTITLAIVSKQGLNTISKVIHPYPTQAEAVKKAADAYRRTLLTPRTKALLRILSRL